MAVARISGGTSRTSAATRGTCGTIEEIFGAIAAICSWIVTDIERYPVQPCPGPAPGQGCGAPHPNLPLPPCAAETKPHSAGPPICLQSRILVDIAADDGVKNATRILQAPDRLIQRLRRAGLDQHKPVRRGLNVGAGFALCRSEVRSVHVRGSEMRAADHRQLDNFMDQI